MNEEIEFGDLEEDDRHMEIEDWEVYDVLLAERGMNEEERRALWRSLDPDTPLHDWAEQLMTESMMTAEDAQAYMREVGAALAAMPTGEDGVE